MAQVSLPSLSTIIPVFNGEKFLAMAIDSVLDQTYSNIECVVVNDGSTDGTATIARSYGKRIRYVDKPNRGVSSARNAGIEASAGQLIAFLDADDMWVPNKIERQVDLFLKNQNVGLIYSSVLIVDENGSVLDEIRNQFKDDILKRILLLETPSFLTMTGVVPKSVLDDIGMFDERLSTSADADLACRISLKYKTLAMDEPLALYRQHNGQMHLNLVTLEHDANLLFQKIFAEPTLPQDIAKLKTKAYASLESTLAIGYLSQRKGVPGIRHLVRGFRSSPIVTVQKFMKLFGIV